MKVSGQFVLTGVQCRPGFKDPSKMTYMVAFADGVDSLRLFVDASVYDDMMKLPLYKPYRVNFDYNPVNQRMNLIGWEEVKS